MGVRFQLWVHNVFMKWASVRPATYAGVLCNIGYPSETHLKLKSRDISFVHNIRFHCPIGLKFCTEHGSDTAVLCAKFQNDRSTEAWVMDKRDFARFEFKMNFGRISYIVLWLTVLHRNRTVSVSLWLDFRNRWWNIRTFDMYSRTFISIHIEYSKMLWSKFTRVY